MSANDNDANFFDLFEKLFLGKSSTTNVKQPHKFRVAPLVFNRFMRKHGITQFQYGQAGRGKQKQNTRFQFGAMASEQDWDENERREIFVDFGRMLWTELDSRYNLRKLNAMQAICVFYGLAPRDSPPASAEKCKALIDKLYVCIWHFADGNNRKFHSFKELKRYTIDGGMTYPLDAAKENPILRSLLKLFRNPKKSKQASTGCT